MVLHASTSFKARKTPVQARSSATVDAIFEASIQVLLRSGAERLTTTRVAERAGVSVGTLYQYYPNKQSLLFAVLELHLGKVTVAVEETCRQNRHLPLATMVAALIEAFVDAKLERKDASVALYSVASELDGEILVAKLRKRSHAAITAMLKTAPGMHWTQLDFTVQMLLSSMAGATRAVLEAGASGRMVEDLRRHLVLLCEAYLNASGTKLPLRVRR